MAEKNNPLKICNTTIYPGERITLALPTPELYTCIPMHIPIHVIHGKKAGPCLLVCATMHGDEMNGIEIIQNLLNTNKLKSIYGTLIAIPVVNVYGLLNHSRKLPDQRDLENNFPGSEKGTFAERLAYSLNQNIFNLATHFIDIHTGEPHQDQFPQIHVDTNQPSSLELASVFQTPVIVHDDSNRGLLWKNTEKQDKPIILYEAGEALRLDKRSIRFGVSGILKVMRHIKMLPSKNEKKLNPMICKETKWIQSPGSGISKILKKSGSYVKKNEIVATIKDPFGTKKNHKVLSSIDAIIIGQNTFPLLNEGDPLLELAPINGEKAFSEKDWEVPPKEN